MSDPQERAAELLLGLRQSETELAECVRTFREEVTLQYKQCADARELLQRVRKQAREVLHILDSPVFCREVVKVHNTRVAFVDLDNKKAAKLILEMELLANDVLRQSGETRTQAKERIESHVDIQEKLDAEAHYLHKAIGSMLWMVVKPEVEEK